MSDVFLRHHRARCRAATWRRWQQRRWQSPQRRSEFDPTTSTAAAQRPHHHSELTAVAPFAISRTTHSGASSFGSRPSIHVRRCPTQATTQSVKSVASDSRRMRWYVFPRPSGDYRSCEAPLSCVHECMRVRPNGLAVGQPPVPDHRPILTNPRACTPWQACRPYHSRTMMTTTTTT